MSNYYTDETDEAYEDYFCNIIREALGENFWIFDCTFKHYNGGSEGVEIWFGMTKYEFEDKLLEKEEIKTRVDAYLKELGLTTNIEVTKSTEKISPFYGRLWFEKEDFDTFKRLCLLYTGNRGCQNS